MNTKNKIILILFLIIGMLLTNIIKVDAHSIELDPKSLITMPSIIINGKGTINIKSSITDYQLYFQSVQISSTNYSEIEEIKAEANKLKEEVDNYKEIYNSAYNAYKNDTTNEELKTAYENAKTNYENKVEEYNNKVSQMKTEVNKLTPTYIETNWIQTTDKRVSIDTTQFSGKQAFVIWVKLVTNNETYYDEDIYTIEGTKEKDVPVTGLSLNEENLSIESGKSYTLSATITPSNATNKTLKWSSDNENIATVSNGTITAKSVGTANITVTTSDGKYTATCKVTVTEKKSSETDESGKSDTEKKPTETGKTDNDETTAKEKIPQTGVLNISIILIATIGVLAIIFYRKYKNLNIQ